MPRRPAPALAAPTARVSTAAHLPATMAAVVLTGHGSRDQLQYRTDVPVPQLRPGELLVRVHACALNQTDVNTRVGWYEAGALTPAQAAEEAGTWSGTPLRFPLIQGSSIAGRVAAVGAGVSAACVGQRVAVDPLIRPEPGSAAEPLFIGSERDGGYAEYVAVPSRCAHPVEGPLSDVAVAAAQVAHTTAEEMLIRGRLTVGETLLVTGASGGVGSALVQLGRRRGARVIAISRAAKRSAVASLGASDVITREPGQDVSGALAHLGTRSVDVVADVVGGDVFEPLVRVLRIGGRYLTAGAIGGPSVRLDLRNLIYKDVEVHGVGSLGSDRAVRAVQRYLAAGEVTPVVAAVFPLARLAAAQEVFERRDHVGRIVIEIGAREQGASDVARAGTAEI